MVLVKSLCMYEWKFKSNMHDQVQSTLGPTRVLSTFVVHLGPEHPSGPLGS